MGVRNRSSRKKQCGRTILGITLVLALLSFLTQGIATAAATTDSPITAGAITTAPVGADVDDWTGATSPANRTDSLMEHNGATDDVIVNRAIVPRPGQNTNSTAAAYDGRLVLHEPAPPIPPPKTVG